jgi:hypothetical protein
LTVDEAIQMILDAEDEIAIAQGLKRRTSTMRQKVTQSMVFNDDDLSYMASQVSGTLTSATANRPRPQHRKPNRDTLRKSMLASSDLFTDTPTTVTSNTTPVPSTTASGASSTAASRTSSGQADGEAHPVKPERKKRKSKAVKGTLPPVEVTFRPPDFKASELHLTPEQQLQVMTLVKEGTLTMDEAMARVMEVEADVQRKEAGPQVDEEGFTVVADEAADPTKPDAFAAAFASKEEEEDSDFDDSAQPSPVAKAKFRLRINSKPVIDTGDPFAGATVSQAASGDPFADPSGEGRARLDTATVQEAFGDEDEFVMHAAQSTENLTVGLAVAAADPFAVESQVEAEDVAGDQTEPAVLDEAGAVDDVSSPVEADLAEAVADEATDPAADGPSPSPGHGDEDVPAVAENDPPSTMTDAEASPTSSKPAPPPVARRRSSSEKIGQPTITPKPAPPPVRKRASTESAKDLGPKPDAAPAPTPKPRSKRASTVGAGEKPGLKAPPATKPKPLSSPASTESFAADLKAPPATKPKPLSSTASTESFSADLKKPASGQGSDVSSKVNSPKLPKAAPPKPAAKPTTAAEPAPKAVSPGAADLTPNMAASEPTSAAKPAAVAAAPTPKPAAPTTTSEAPEPAAAPKRSLKDRLKVASSLPDEPTPAPQAKPAAPAASRSKIYQALNAQPLWAESAADKAKREARNLVVGVGSGASQRAAATYVHGYVTSGLQSMCWLCMCRLCVVASPACSSPPPTLGC